MRPDAEVGAEVSSLLVNFLKERDGPESRICWFKNLLFEASGSERCQVWTEVDTVMLHHSDSPSGLRSMSPTAEVALSSQLKPLTGIFLAEEKSLLMFPICLPGNEMIAHFGGANVKSSCLNRKENFQCRASSNLWLLLPLCVVQILPLPDPAAIIHHNIESHFQ